MNTALHYDLYYGSLILIWLITEHKLDIMKQNYIKLILSGTPRQYIFFWKWIGTKSIFETLDGCQ